MTAAPLRRALIFSLLILPFAHLAHSDAKAGSASLNTSDPGQGITATNDAVAGEAANALSQSGTSTASTEASDDQINKISAKRLSGAVHMAAQKETALSTVLIEECDASWSRVLGSTRTDYQGNFKLKPAKRGKTYYLRVSAKGFYTRHYEVTLSPNSPDELKLELQLASRSQSGGGRIRQSRLSLS
ncbi:MAG TPA: hypothetical protein VGM27_04375 [Acidobacteriaceae bacterium]|jgi:hypothetical protein